MVDYNQVVVVRRADSEIVVVVQAGSKVFAVWVGSHSKVAAAYDGDSFVVEECSYNLAGILTVETVDSSSLNRQLTLS